MTFDLGCGLPGLREIHAEWEDLARREPRLGFIQTPELFEAYADRLVSRPEHLLWVSARDSGGRLAAVLPLERKGSGGRRLALISHDHIALSDVAARPGQGGLWEGLWRWLQDTPLDWVSLELPRVNSDSLLDGWILAKPPRMTITRLIDGTAWLPCDRDYGDLLKGASANHRSSLSRGLKRAWEMGALVYENHRSADQLAAALPDFLDVEASGWKGREGGAVACQSALVGFYGQLAQRMGSQGHCEIDLLRLDGRAISTIFWFRNGEMLHLQKIAYREELSSIGPGKLIVAEALKRACSDPVLKRVSFITRCPWADGWRTRIMPVRSHLLYRENFRGRLAWLLRRAVLRARSSVRSLRAACKKLSR